MGPAGFEMVFLTPKEFFTWNDKTDDEFFFEMYLVPENENENFGFMVATDPAYKDMIFYDSNDKICYMVVDYDHFGEQVLGFSIIDPYETCPYLAEGWTYTPFVTNPDNTPNSLTGPDGKRWYFLTNFEKEQRYGPIPEPITDEADEDEADESDMSQNPFEDQDGPEPDA